MPTAPTPNSVVPLLGENPDVVGWRRVRGVARLFLGCLAVLLVGTVVTKLGVRELHVDLALTALVAVVACLALVFGWKTLAPTLRTTGGTRGLLAAIVGWLAIAGLAQVYFPVFRWLGFPFVRCTDIYVDAGFPTWSTYLFISLVPAICEEIVFRGYITARLSDLLSPIETIVVQAALFALIHLSPVVFPSHFVMGVVFGIVRRRAGSLYPSMFAHAAWNACVVFSEVGW